MWVDMDDLRAELESLRRENEEEFAGRRNRETLHCGMMIGFHKVDEMLDELEEVYRKQGLEYIRSLMEE